MLGHISSPLRAQLTPPALLSTGVSQQTSTSSVSEQTWTVTGSLVPSLPISTLKDSILTLSSLPELVGFLGLAVGGRPVGGLGGLGLGVGEGTPRGFGQLRLLLESRLQVRLLTVSVGPTL